jgi:hypothetical protein
VKNIFVVLNKPEFGNYDGRAEQCFKLEPETSPLLLSENLIFQLSLRLALFPYSPVRKTPKKDLIQRLNQTSSKAQGP